MVMVEEITRQGRTNLDIDSYLMKKSNTIYLTGEINDDKAMEIIKKIQYINEKGKDDVVLVINSPGGSVTAGLAIYDMIQASQNDVVTIGIGQVASMGAFLLASGNKRYVYPHCEIMIHQVSSQLAGNVIDMDISIDRIKSQNEMILDLLAKHTHNTYEKIQQYTQRDYYLDAQQALKLGMIDKIL